MKKLIMSMGLLAVTLLLAIDVLAEESQKTKVHKNVKYRKTQEVSFEGDDVDGLKRNPYGAYLVQKRGIDFAPLYKVKDKFDSNIKSSVDYLE